MHYRRTSRRLNLIHPLTVAMADGATARMSCCCRSSNSSGVAEEADKRACMDPFIVVHGSKLGKTRADLPATPVGWPW